MGVGMQISLHIKVFNEKVRIMNQTNGKSLVLNTMEARNLHNDIFVLMAQIAELSQTQTAPIEPTGSVAFDGGTF